ncbi:hypothetical protein BD626DRAFT_544813 [Schizophyllum amplum]|uniref:F-box domain-containing protein n=1 Tax=Schizophyllum amplum TaxID=97359 RepID=A0A550D0D2_9AGAR|nr:hypothetical protein BD626DRAFT_544813 [Auriculariopsis ampla]
MRLIASTAHRWEEISIILFHEPPKTLDVIQPLLALPRDSFASLKRAMLRFEHDRRGSAASRLWEMFYASPALRTVQLSYIRMQAPPSILRQLTRLGVNVIGSDEVMDLLRACPQLEIFQAIVQPPSHIFPGIEDGYLIPIVPTPIVLPHLRVLMLSGLYDWSHFFEGLAAPRLDRLDMNQTGIQADAVQGMLQRSCAQLRMLALRSIYAGNDSEIVALLRCDELRHLEILRHVPYEGYDDPPDLFDPSPYLPPGIALVTRAYEEAENAYQSMRRT